MIFIDNHLVCKCYKCTYVLRNYSELIQIICYWPFDQLLIEIDVLVLNLMTTYCKRKTVLIERRLETQSLLQGYYC